MPDQHQPARVLLVDDDLEFLHATAAALSRRGFEVTPAPTAFVAMRHLANQYFDLAIVDLKLPGIEGDELFAEIQAEWPDVPVLILSGHVDAALAEQFVRQGAIGVLCKPCEVEHLARVLNRAIRVSSEPIAHEDLGTG